MLGKLFNYTDFWLMVHWLVWSHGSCNLILRREHAYPQITLLWMKRVSASCCQWANSQQHNLGALFLEHSSDTAGKPRGQTTYSGCDLIQHLSYSFLHHHVTHYTCHESWSCGEMVNFLVLKTGHFLICFQFIIMLLFCNSLIFPEWYYV